MIKYKTLYSIKQRHENCDVCIGADCAADQHLCFHYIDCTFSLLPKSKIARVKLSSVAVQSGLYQTWSETPKTGFPFVYKFGKFHPFILF